MDQVLSYIVQFNLKGKLEKIPFGNKQDAASRYYLLVGKIGISNLKMVDSSGEIYLENEPPDFDDLPKVARVY